MKKILAQVLTCDFCENLKNIDFYRTPPVAASVPFIILFKCEMTRTQILLKAV